MNYIIKFKTYYIELFTVIFFILIPLTTGDISIYADKTSLIINFISIVFLSLYVYKNINFIKLSNKIVLYLLIYTIYLSLNSIFLNSTIYHNFYLQIILFISLIIINKYNELNLLNIIKILSYIYLFFIIFSHFLIAYNFNDNLINLYQLSSLFEIRSSGLARISAILSIFYFYDYTLKKKLSDLVILILLISIIILTKSRISITLVFLIFMFIFITLKGNIKNNLFIIFVSFVALIFIFISRGTENLLSLNNRLNWVIYFVKNINFVDYFIPFGYQFDRIYLNESLSNAYIYILISQGIFIFLFLFTFMIYFIVKYFSKELLLPFSLIFFFLARSLFENSISLFGLDALYFILLICYVFKTGHPNCKVKKIW